MAKGIGSRLSELASRAERWAWRPSGLSDEIRGSDLSALANSGSIEFVIDKLDPIQAEGKKLAWPRNMNYELAEQPTDYPKAVWKEAKARWESKSAEEQTAEIDAQTEMMDQMQAMFRDQLTKEAFKESFSPIDLLFFGLAIFTAFKLGSGMTDD